LLDSLADAQQTEKVRRIGFLSAATPDPQVDAGFRQGLREHGYNEGQNLRVECDSQKAGMIGSPGSLRNSSG
jgi:hypothetical protein